MNEQLKPTGLYENNAFNPTILFLDTDAIKTIEDIKIVLKILRIGVEQKIVDSFSANHLFKE